jgi:hypothetical protein
VVVLGGLDFCSGWVRVVVLGGLGWLVMVFNVTFNNISAISWRSEVPGEDHQSATSH